MTLMEVTLMMMLVLMITMMNDPAHDPQEARGF